MEMYNHQNVLHSQLVANTQAASAARRGLGAHKSWRTSSNMASSCSHQSGSPLQGAAMEAAWARPATTNHNHPAAFKALQPLARP